MRHIEYVVATIVITGIIVSLLTWSPAAKEAPKSVIMRPRYNLVDSGRYHIVQGGDTVAGVLGRHLPGIDRDNTLLYNAVAWTGINPADRIETGNKVRLPKVFDETGKQVFTLVLDVQHDKY